MEAFCNKGQSGKKQFFIRGHCGQVKRRFNEMKCNAVLSFSSAIVFSAKA